jgi:PadR family transcriptional regulator AphA
VERCSERELSTGEAAVLGALLLGPRHGYELANLFSELGITEVLPAEQPTLYGYLRSLEGSGHVAWHEERAGSRPPRKVYRPTERGRKAAEEWLARPVGRLRQIRQEFLVKLALLEALGRSAQRNALVAAQVDACRAYLQRLLGEQPSSPVAKLNRSSRASAAAATIAWLESLLTPCEVEQ